MTEADDTDHVALRFPIEELRELGFDPSPLPSPEMPRPGYTASPASYATPWRVADYDERVLVLDADGTSLFEVFPGQANGYVATREDRRAIAEHIVHAVNATLGHGYQPAFIAQHMAAERRAARRLLGPNIAEVHDHDRLADDGNPHHGDE